MGVLKAHQNGAWVPIGGGGSSSSEPEIHVGNSEPTNANVELWLDTSEEGTSATAENIGALPIDGTAADAEKLCGKPPEQYLQPRNLLDNSDFTNPVNQRGQTSYTGSAYSVDRWRAFHADTTHEVVDGGIRVSSEGVNPNLYQALDASKLKEGQIYTAAACDIEGNICIWTGTKDNITAVAPICVYISGERLLFRLSSSNTTWVWAALYEGEYTVETLPPYVPKGYAAELVECQRYFYVMPNKASFTYPGYSASATTGYFMVTLPVAMRVTPTLSVAEIGNVQVFRYNSTAAATAISLYAVDNNAVTFKITSSGMSAWACVTVRFNTEATLSADL